MNRTAMASRYWHPKTSLRPSPAPLLLNRRGHRLSVRGASDIRAIAADANLDEDHITAHVGRHTFATTLIRGGTDLVALADMLGHARLDTVRLYTHPSAADRERALNLLPYDANQARWRYYTYLVATPCTAAGRGAP
jgi:integrase/recombinase XerC